MPVGDSVGGFFDLGPSMVITGNRIDVFEEGFGPVQRFTSVDGGAFARSTVPNSSPSSAVQAIPDPPGDILLVEERLGRQIVLQRSRNNWVPETIGTGRYPSAAIGADGVVHVVMRDWISGEVSYSNSARTFSTWTPLPIPPVVGQQLLPMASTTSGSLAASSRSTRPPERSSTRRRPGRIPSSSTRPSRTATATRSRGRSPSVNRRTALPPCPAAERSNFSATRS